MSEQVQQVIPGPVPTQLGAVPVPMSDGQTFVMCQITTPVGTTVVFLDPATAKRFASILVDAAVQAKARGGLIVPQVKLGPITLNGQSEPLA